MTNPATVEERIANLEGSFAQIASRLDRVEQDVRDLRTAMNQRFNRLEQRVDRIVFWQLGLLGAVAISIAVTLLTRLL